MTTGFVPIYDLEAADEGQRQEYVKAVCKHLGVPDNLNLIRLTYYDEGDGPRRLVCYAKRGATELVRERLGINVIGLDSKEVGGSYVVTATGKNEKGRQEMSQGSKYIKDLVGRPLDDAIMTAQTRAVRRMTLQFTGTGILDESEVNPQETVETKNTTATAVPVIPTVAPSEKPGKDVTVDKVQNLIEQVKKTPLEDIVPGKRVVSAEELEQFEKQQTQMRADAIAALNAKHKQENEKPEKKVEPVKVAEDIATAPSTGRRRGRKPKNHVDLNEAQPVLKGVVNPVLPVAPPQPVTQGAAVQTTDPPKAVETKPIVAPSKAKLTPEQIKPYRQRLFKIVTKLEQAGFAPKEGMGNHDKMRAFANTGYPEVTNFNELTEKQWEMYLSGLESRITTEGAVATAKYIEDSIGI